MATFLYKLEYCYESSSPADASVFIQIRDNPPIYQEHIDKEAYDILSDGLKHEFLTALFNIAGVVELSTKAYRVWFMKSPAYQWLEVVEPFIFYMSDYFGYADGPEAMPGSANLDGTGFTLDSLNSRRKI
jgi:hypothetical protein